MEFLKKMVEFFISKKKIIGWVAGSVFVFGAAQLGMGTKEFKDAVCSVEIVDKPAPLPQPVLEAPKVEEKK